MTLGIDIGGTTIGLGVVQDGKIIRKVSVPSFPAGATLDQTLDYLSEQIAGILPAEATKIGIGVPTVVDVEKGIVYEATNIPSWQEVHLKECLEARFPVTVAVNNDANCFAMGAYAAYPKEQKPEVLVGITLGTGVGIGIIDRGRLFGGANCGAGELGCLPFRSGILEDYCSKKFFESRNLISLEMAQAAEKKDPKALALFDELGANLGELVCAVLFAYDPSHIAFGGGVSYNYPYFRKSMEDYMKKNFPYHNTVDRLKIDVFTGGDVLVTGAALI